MRRTLAEPCRSEAASRGRRDKKGVGRKTDSLGKLGKRPAERPPKLRYKQKAPKRSAPGPFIKLVRIRICRVGSDALQSNLQDASRFPKTNWAVFQRVVDKSSRCCF